MSAAELEEMKRLRAALGLKALPTPGSGGPQFKEKARADDEEAASTLETREAASTDNYKKHVEAELARKRREEKSAAVKKARDTAKRFEVMQGKGLGDAEDAGDLDAKSWLMSQKKRQKRIDQARKLEEELAAAEAAAAAAIQYTSKDLAGVKVAHEATAFENGDEQILTLKDTNVLADNEEGDELENVDLRERETLNERLDLKKKKPVYDPHAIEENGDQSILAHYDEEISGKKVNKFTLDAQGSAVPVDERQPRGRSGQKIDLDLFNDEPQPASDYLDISEIKVKKTKKKKIKSTRLRRVEDDDEPHALPEPAVHGEAMDIDGGSGYVGKKRKIEDTAFIDDGDLQATLAKQRREALKKHKRTRPGDIARQLREELKEDAQTLEAESLAGPVGGLVIDEISEFVSNLQKEDVEVRRPRASKTPNREVVPTMEDEDGDHHMIDAYDLEERPRDNDTSAPANHILDEEKSIGAGVGAALQLLRERHLLENSGSAELNEKLRKQQIFIAEKKRKLAEIEQEARSQRERERKSGKLDNMSARDREEWQRQQNNLRDQQSSRQMAELFKTYTPNVELKYFDEHGRSLDKKEAFKHMSHQFHGKGSGKGKTDKYLKKIEDEKRREAQSILDTSQNVGMSSATAQQTKKRKEAGVRLA